MSHACRFCSSPLEASVIDLGSQPPSNAYLSELDLDRKVSYYPLKVFLCTNCWLMQLPDHAAASDLFTSDYAYLSSTSPSWCRHASDYVSLAIDRLSLDNSSQVIELASNDGYLLQYFYENSIPALGIEPTSIAAQHAREKGIETIEDFFGVSLASTLPKADLLIANNVLAHVPDLNDFVEGISHVLKSTGVATLEFPHLHELLKHNQFDTIYHEHYSYFSLYTVERVFARYGLNLFDVQQLSTHGGSLRVWLAKDNRLRTPDVERVLKLERDNGLLSLQAFSNFQKRAEHVKYQLLEFLLKSKLSGTQVIGYGAAAKGNTLLNYAGVMSDLLPYVLDRAITKQNKYMPGSRIPIYSPDLCPPTADQTLLILPWNLVSEIHQSYPSNTVVTPIPALEIRPPLSS